MERIISITELNDKKIDYETFKDVALYPGEGFDGYEIVTSEHVYMILIDNTQNCCESWGYIVSEDNFEDFIGKELISVELTDTALNKDNIENIAKYKEKVDDIIDCINFVNTGGIQFVDFKMSDGNVLQFAVYNEHNGYYGHSIIVAKDNKILLQDTL